MLIIEVELNRLSVPCSIGGSLGLPHSGKGDDPKGDVRYLNSDKGKTCI